MTAETFTRSFAGGEISPLLYGRLDLAKNQTGLALAENFLITPQGPAENRPGFAYVNRARDTATPPALIPFTYNTDQSFSLEFGNGYIRFHTLGGTLLEAAKAISGVTQASPGVFACAAHGYSAGQWLFLQTVSSMPDLTNRWGIVATVPDANHFTLTDLFGVPIDTSAMPAYTGGGTASRLYEIASPYAAADLFDLHYVQSADVLTIVHQGYAPRELRRLGATNWTLTAISWGTTIAAPGTPTLTTSGPGGGSPIPYSYITTAIVFGSSEETTASPAAFTNIDLSVAGNAVDIAPALVTGAGRYNVYKMKNASGLPGFIGQTDGSAFRDDNIFADTSKTPPIQLNPFGTESPRAVSYYEQRRCFGGGGLNPQNVWTTRSGTERNLTYSIPTQDDDAITARIVAREAQTVRHLVPFNDLLALTSGGVWRIASSDGGAITPATFSVKPHSYVGASNVQPIVTNSSVLYAPARGSHLRELTYKWEVQGYQAEDVSVLAPHLVDFHRITQMAYSKTPYQVLWAVRDDGTLLGLTHQPEHDVKAWHQHTTAGSFKSVCAIDEGDEDGLYVVVQRHVQGADWYYIERLHSRQFAQLQSAFFVDSGATYSGAPAASIGGLWHLEGLEVAILADGGVHPRRTVSNGHITLVAPASVVQVGLPYNADAQTMPLALEAAAAFGQGIPKNVNKAWLSVYQSGAGIQAGPSFDKLHEYKQRTIADPYGTPPALKSGIAEITLTPTWQQDGSVCIRQPNPLPLTLRALTLEVAQGG